MDWSSCELTLRWPPCVPASLAPANDSGLLSRLSPSRQEALQSSGNDPAPVLGCRAQTTSAAQPDCLSSRATEATPPRSSALTTTPTSASSHQPQRVKLGSSRRHRQRACHASVGATRAAVRTSEDLSAATLWCAVAGVVRVGIASSEALRDSSAAADAGAAAAASSLGHRQRRCHPGNPAAAVSSGLGDHTAGEYNARAWTFELLLPDSRELKAAVRSSINYVFAGVALEVRLTSATVWLHATRILACLANFIGISADCTFNQQPHVQTRATRAASEGSLVTCLHVSVAHLQR